MKSLFDNFRERRYLFINQPKECSLTDYKTAIGSLLESLSKQPDVKSIYQFGSINCPGISDIDIAIVFNDNSTQKYFFDYKMLTEKEGYIFLHPPSALLNQHLFENLQYIIPIFNIQKVYGETLKLQTNRKEQKIRDLILLNDAIFTGYPRNFFNILFSKEINIRLTLNILHALRYPIQLIKTTFNIKEKEGWKDYLNRIQKLRGEWFNFDNTKRNKELIELLIEAAIISLEFIETYSTRLNLVHLTPDNITFRDRNLQTIFLKKWDRQTAMEKTINFYKNNSPRSILPLNLSSQLFSYASVNNNLGRFIKRGICPNQDITFANCQNAIFQAQIKRLKLIQELVSFTLQKKYLRGALTPWDLGYMWHRGFANKIRDVYYSLTRFGYG